MMLFEPSPVINGRIRAMWGAMPAHQRPLWNAVLQGCTYASVVQGDGPFRIPTGRPAVVVFGDDLDASKGPAAFHGPSLDRYLARCGGVAVVSCEALPEAYAAIALQAVAFRHDVALVETQEAHAAAWRARVGRSAPLAGLLLAQTRETEGVS